MSFFGTHDFALEVSLDKVTGYKSLNKFGMATDADSASATDIWDAAFAGGVKIWIPPTAARVHSIVSASGNDTLLGTGMQTIRVYYLADWTTAETSVDLDMAGAGGVNTPACVMINRMHAIDLGTGGVNAGLITATAAVDGTVTSAIRAGQNQTQQAIYGIPSVEKFRMERARCDIVAGLGATADLDGTILFMRDPATNVANNTAWTVKENFAVVESTLPWIAEYRPPKKFDGPGIVKIQVTTNTNNSDVIGRFDGYLVTT